jgi:hypothetical protein
MRNNDRNSDSWMNAICIFVRLLAFGGAAIVIIVTGCDSYQNNAGTWNAPQTTVSTTTAR